MNILFDTLRFQNPTHEGRKGPIVAEIGVIVNTMPSEFTNADGNTDYIDLSANVQPGYYYITIVYRSKNVQGINIDSLEKKYIVSDESIFEYIFGVADEDDPPKYIESYDRIEDAVNSDFLSFFLFMQQLIDVSREDQALVNNGRRKSKLLSEIETTVQIERVDKFSIVSKAVISETPHSDLHCEVVLDEENGQGRSFGLYLYPRCCFIKNEDEYCTESFPSLDSAYGSKYFSDYARLKKATEEYLLSYFEREAADLEKRFSKEEIAALKTGILGIALGVKEYQ